MTIARRKQLGQLQRRLPKGTLRTDERTLQRHAGDKWFATNPPDAVAFPRSAKAVSEILKFANRHRIPVTARGAGQGYVGGCVPVRGGIALSLAKMKRIREISGSDFVAVVQPGVITAELQDAAEAKGLYYPPDPASRADCSIGGNIATNAGGPRCLKYGVTRDYVLGLEVVLPDGSIAKLGGRCHKNKTGFDLARFFVGSEGLLGIVTGATLKLLPLPPFRSCVGMGFGSMRHATRAIQAIFKAGFLPSAVEVADAFTLAAARDTIRLLSWFKTNAPHCAILIVANRVHPASLLEISRKDFEQSIERKVDILIPFDLRVASQAAKLGKTMADVAKGSKVGAACAALLNEALGSEDKDGDVRPSGKGESLLNKIDLKGMLAARRKDKVASED